MRGILAALPIRVTLVDVAISRSVAGYRFTDLAAQLQSIDILYFFAKH
jgi:hypothetical protein